MFELVTRCVTPFCVTRFNSRILNLGKILPHFCPWTVYSWKNIPGETLNFPYAYQCSDSAKNRSPISEVNTKILSWSPAPLSKIKNYSLLAVSWYSQGITSRFLEFGGMFRSGRVFSDISPKYWHGEGGSSSSSPLKRYFSIRCHVFLVVFQLLFPLFV